MALSWQYLMEAADQVGIKLEIVEGNTVWEAAPSTMHQDWLFRIHTSLKPSEGPIGGCGCHAYQDSYIRFPDGSIKRPDLSIFCSRPEPTFEALNATPDAVVELVSEGYEKKDMETGLAFYQKHNIKDILMLNLRSQEILHVTRTGRTKLVAPQTIQLSIGCEITL